MSGQFAVQTLKRAEEILEILKAGPIKGLDLREKLGCKKEELYRSTRYLRAEGKVIMTGQKTGAVWSLSNGAAPRKRTVRNTLPPKSNGQVGTAVAELRSVIARKQDELDNLNRSLVILEASL